MASKPSPWQRILVACSAGLTLTLDPGEVSTLASDEYVLKRAADDGTCPLCLGTGWAGCANCCNCDGTGGLDG